MIDSIALVEKEKYEKIWSFEKYRKNAPGERLVRDAFNKLRMREGDSIIDFGCGTGRPAKKFEDLGLRVTGVDFAKNCLDDDINIPFINSCLWSLPNNLFADFGFCTDVMEHIPESKVDSTISSIKLSCLYGAYFQIATRPDNMGKLIGKTLHLTVRSSDWWELKLQKYFNEVKLQPSRGAIIAICK